MRRSLTLAMAVLGVLGLGACEGAGSSRAALMADMDLSTLVTLDEARAIAQEQVPDGYLIGAELEIEDDDENEPPAWEVSYFVQGSTQIMEVEVHALTGEVLEVEIEDDSEDD